MRFLCVSMMALCAVGVFAQNEETANDTTTQEVVADGSETTSEAQAN